MNFFSSSSRRELNDPVFGLMTCEQSVWTGTAHAHGTTFSTFVIAGPSGPTGPQRLFFENTIQRLPILIDTALQYIRMKTQRSDLPELGLLAIEIGPNVEIAEHRFTLELTPAGSPTVHRVEFRNAEAVGYACDD